MAFGMARRMTVEAESARLGLRANATQFAWLVAVSALVGGMVGQERTVLPLLAGAIFRIEGVSVILTFLVAFGVTKALTNLAAGALADRYGRKPVLVAGWLIGAPVPVLLILAPSWDWVVAANILLGINQGLTWSTTVIMKIDLVGPQRRGLALGINEAAGYGAVAVTALATGWIAANVGLRPGPFVLGLGFVLLGLLISIVVVRETRGYAELEGSARADPARRPRPAWRSVLWQTSIGDPSLSAASQAGLVNNLNDAMAWGLLPIFYAAAGLSLAEIGLLAAIYPAVWGIGQIGTGAVSDRLGRKRLIVAGMLLQGAAIGGIALGTGFAQWAAAAAVLGIGTAMVYPTLMAVVADVADPDWRATSVGVYRMWRDLGFAAGAVLIGVAADRAGVGSAIWIVAGLTVISGVLVAVRMRETLVPRQKRPVPET